MSGPTPKKRRPANPRPRVPRTHTQPFPFLAELADIYGLDEAGEVARDTREGGMVRRTVIEPGMLINPPRGDKEPQPALVLTLPTNPAWRHQPIHDAAVPGGERGLVYSSDLETATREDSDQITVAEKAISRAVLAEIAYARAHQSLKDFVDAEVQRYGSKPTFAAHLVDLLPGPRQPGETAAASRQRQIKAQLRKLEEWTQIWKHRKKSDPPDAPLMPANPKRPGFPKYTEPGVSKLANNAKRIAAARGDARRWAVRVLRGMSIDIGLRGWWRATSQQDDHQFPAEAETRPAAAPAVRKVIEADGADFIQLLEETKRGAELLVLYQLKVTLHNYRRTVAAGPQDGA